MAVSMVEKTAIKLVALLVEMKVELMDTLSVVSKVEWWDSGKAQLMGVPMVEWKAVLMADWRVLRMAVKLEKLLVGPKDEKMAVLSVL